MSTPRPSPDLAELLPSWELHLRAERKSPATLRVYVGGARHFLGAADEVGAGPGRGTTRNLPLPDGTDDDAYLEALAEAIGLVAGFDPAAVVVSAGFDTFAGDPLGAFAVTTEGFARVGAALAGLGRPTVVVQEGGYALDALGANAVALLAGLQQPR